MALHIFRDLFPDAFKLLLNQQFWQLKAIFFVKLIQQIALQTVARSFNIAVSDLRAHSVFEFAQIIKAKVFSQIIIDFRQFWLFNQGYLHIKCGFFASQMRRLIGFWEGHGDGFFISSLSADQLIFKTWDKLVRTKL